MILKIKITSGEILKECENHWPFKTTREVTGILFFEKLKVKLPEEEWSKILKVSYKLDQELDLHIFELEIGKETNDGQQRKALEKTWRQFRTTTLN
jgi:hypothetical protein